MSRKLKICLLGATGVGKTSLVARFVHSIFSDTYLTTIGVQIETRQIQRGEQTIELVIWDLSGEDEFQSVQPAYLAGSAGLLVVVDGTRRGTIDTARSLVRRAREVTQDAPFVVVVNKADLVAEWDVRPGDLAPLTQHAGAVVETSARSGQGVSEAFDRLIDCYLERSGAPWT